MWALLVVLLDPVHLTQFIFHLLLHFYCYKLLHHVPNLSAQHPRDFWLPHINCQRHEQVDHHQQRVLGEVIDKLVGESKRTKSENRDAQRDEDQDVKDAGLEVHQGLDCFSNMSLLLCGLEWCHYVLPWHTTN